MERTGEWGRPEGCEQRGRGGRLEGHSQLDQHRKGKEEINGWWEERGKGRNGDDVEETM